MIIFNPGSGPVEGATREDADANILAFIADLAGAGVDASLAPYIERGAAAARDDGRWPYVLDVGGRTFDVEMPGAPLADVRSPFGTPPRLYIDGSSWYWAYALAIVEGGGQ